MNNTKDGISPTIIPVSDAPYRFNDPMGEDCYKPLPDYPEPPTGEPVFPIARARDVAGDSLQYPSDSLTYRWWQRYNLFLSLAANDTILQQDTMLNNFFQDYKQREFVRMDSIKKALSQLDRQTDSLDKYDSLYVELMSIQPANSMEQHSKTVARIYYQTRAMGNELEPSPGDDHYSKLWNIAHLCPFNGGPAVFEARAMLIADSIELRKHDFQSNCNTSLKRGPSRKEEENEKETLTHEEDYDYRLHPNLMGPGNNSATIRLQEDEKGEVTFYSLQGKLIDRYQVEEGTNTLRLSSERFGHGFYLYSVRVDGEKKHVGKLVITR
jgi:hypothetical protein